MSSLSDFYHGICVRSYRPLHNENNDLSLFFSHTQGMIMFFIASLPNVLGQFSLEVLIFLALLAMLEVVVPVPPFVTINPRHHSHTTCISDWEF